MIAEGIAPVDAKLTDEAGRLAALRRYDILDTPAEPAFDHIAALARIALGVPMAAVSLIDEERQWLKGRAGIDSEQTDRRIAMCDHTIRQRRPLIIPDTARDARFLANPLVLGRPHIRGYAGVPIMSPDGYNVGALCAADIVPRAFDAGQIEILGHLAALTVEQMELRRIAPHDFLTDALTRRAFVAELDKQIALHVRHDRPAALLLFDIDRFKAINDTHGHAAGDEVIRAVATLCARLKRPSDLLGRLGGEEFGLLLPEAGEGDAVHAAERFRAAIAGMRVDHGLSLTVTASFGVATLSPDRRHSADWIAAADMAMYEAKRAGRNRIALHGDVGRT